MSRDADLEERRAYSVIGAFYEVYNTLGFGFLEQFYVRALTTELRTRRHAVERERDVTVWYKGEPLGSQRLDLVVDDRLVIEAKSTRVLDRGATRQLYNYLCATRIHDGLLLHFGPEPRFYRVFWNVR